MRAPFFPVSPKMFDAAHSADFEPDDILKPREGIIVRTARLKHPGGVIGYRVDPGKACAMTGYCCRSNEIDPKAAASLTDADLLIYDCMYTDREVVVRCARDLRFAILRHLIHEPPRVFVVHRDRRHHATSIHYTVAE